MLPVVVAAHLSLINMREVAAMKGGVTLFRGTGVDARRYLETDRARADDYYLRNDAVIAQFVQLDSHGDITVAAALDPKAYAGWVDWEHPVTVEQMGIPRHAGNGRKGSPRFAEMIINAPKSLSIAAALHPSVSNALDEAQQDAAAEIRRWLATHSVTRVGPRGRQEIVPVERLHSVALTHRTSRAGDPHRHIHLQIGTRVWAAGAWRALDTAALFAGQGAIRALGTAVIAAHPPLAAALGEHGLTLDPVTGEVRELQPFNRVMSKRAAQVVQNLEHLESKWQQDRPGETIGPALAARLQAVAWAQGRPAKKPVRGIEESAWAAELHAAGYDEAALTRAQQPPVVMLDDLSIEAIAARALDRCAASASAWTVHALTESVTQLTTEHGVRADREELRSFINLAVGLAGESCFSILPVGTAAPEHVAHLTTVRVAAVEEELRDALTARVAHNEAQFADLAGIANASNLDAEQRHAAAAIAGSDALVVLEGAAGAGKTTMLAAAIAAAQGDMRVVAPTKKAADVAAIELGVKTDSVAAFVYAHGWRWNSDGAWSRLAPGETDPDTGRTYRGPGVHAALGQGNRIVVDEAGMLDQDTALALFTVANEVGATVALVGDRAQLPAVGRGGVLDMAAHIAGGTIDLTSVHRFADPTYAQLTLAMRDAHEPGEVFDLLATRGLIRLHASDDDARDAIAGAATASDSITVSANDEATALNEIIHAQRVTAGAVDTWRTVEGADGLEIGAGDHIQTRRNDARLGVANRQMWVVQHVDDDGSIWVLPQREQHGVGYRSVHLPAEYVEAQVQLAYAATAYGTQGVTAPSAHTLLTEASTAAGLYVGMTRGRAENLLHAVAENLADARAQFVDAMQRDRADRGLAVATQRAAESVRDLIEAGPASRVREEIRTLRDKAAHAERLVHQWREVAETLASLPRPLTPQMRLRAAAQVFGAEAARKSATQFERARPEREISHWELTAKNAAREASKLEDMTPGDALTHINDQQRRETQRKLEKPQQRAPGWNASARQRRPQDTRGLGL